MLYEIDLKNAEARIVDYCANEVKMIKAYEKGLDPYKIIGAEIFSVPYEDVSDEAKSSGFSEKSQRAVAKECKLAFQYGMKHVTFAERADLPLRIAKQLREQYLNSICPNLRRNYWRYIEECLKSKKAVTDLFGKTYRFFGQWNDSLLHAAYNYIPQSSVGRIINSWGLTPILEEGLKPKWRGEAGRFTPIGPLIQEHDSIKFQIRDSYLPKVHARCLHDLVTSLERPLSFQAYTWVIPCEVAAGYNLAKWSEKENPRGLKEIEINSNLEKQLEEIKDGLRSKSR